MSGLHKHNLFKHTLAFAVVAFITALTWKSEARRVLRTENYSTLTKDTTEPLKKRTGRPANVVDTTPRTDRFPRATQRDTVPALPDTATLLRRGDTVVPRIDTFNVRLSKDTLSGPVNYEASDSAVVMVEDQKIVLYGKTRTTYEDITLTAPKVELNQRTNILTAIADRDSTGDIGTRARFEQGENQFESDSIRFNFKTQRGLTQNTYTQQNEMYVQGKMIKKVDPTTFFVHEGRFTTCNLDHPHFAFKANKMKLINNKVAVSGPVHPEFEEVPLPIYLPFGYFPLSRGRHSGFLPPQFASSEDFGLGLEGLGYYKVLNEYFDVTLRGNIYSYGGWSLNLTPTYRKRYRYNGSMNFSLQHTKLNFKGDPDFQKTKTFFVTWNHSVDQRARPGTSFSASVNAGSTKYNEYVTNNPLRNFQNNLSSSISYSKSWAGKPYNLTLSANHNQNSATGQIFMNLPDASFTVQTLYPLQRKMVVGAPKWYEKLGIGYNGSFRNQFSFYENSTTTLKKVLDTLQWSANHSIPITVSLPALGPLIVSPGISYEERWVGTRYNFENWSRAKNKVDTTVSKGLFADRQMSFSLGFSTALYGTFQLGNGKAIRHVMRPSLSMSYRPDLSGKYYESIQIDSIPGRTYLLPQLGGYGFGYGRSGGIGFTLDNNLEMKTRSRKDTGDAAIKKVRLIDGFGFSTYYNFLADTMKLSPLSIYLRSSLFDKISLNASAELSPYRVNSFGFPVSSFAWDAPSRYALQDVRKSIGRLTQVSISMSTDFQSKPRDPDQAPKENPLENINDPALLGDIERQTDYIRRNPAEFVDFNIPWSVNLSYGLTFRKQITAAFKDTTIINSNLSVNGSFSLTPKWNFSATGYYDFNTMELQMFTMSIAREMHCWQMAIGVTPIGRYSTFNISISPKSSILQDLRINRTRTFYNY